MSIGASIFLIAVGAILRYAVTAQVVGIDIQTVGLILMIAGVIGMLLALFFYAQNSSRNRASNIDDRRPPGPPTGY